MGVKTEGEYQGFEQGPIRPPSEATSLLIRVTRNCPWNRCEFCAVYKHDRFSVRPVDHVIADIDQIYDATMRALAEWQKTGQLTGEQVLKLGELYPGESERILATALGWLINGDGSVFLQDANSVIIKPKDLITILRHLRSRFPWISRITSYARSHTITKISDAAMKEIADAGLSRIHIGLETGCDELLELVDKGVTKQQHIEAGQRVKRAGIELSEYVMPGLGGRELSLQHALETADALNRIDADFIRLRTLSLTPGVPLNDRFESGELTRSSDLEIVREIRTMIASLEWIASTIKSDHFYNLLENVDGRLPEDKSDMLRILDRFLDMPSGEQALFQLGRRVGYFQTMDDLLNAAQRTHAEEICERFGITPANVDRVIAERIRRPLI